jgi:hypothetical protein
MFDESMGVTVATIYWKSWRSLFFRKVIFIFGFVVAFVPSSFAAPEELIELLRVHEQWVTAFENADIEAADKVWSHEDDVKGIDPIGFKAVGWQEVRKYLQWGFAFIGPSETVTWDVVVSAEREKGSVTLNYIWKGVLENKTFKNTELYRKEKGQWKLYYNDAKGLKPPLFPDDEEAIKRLVAKVTHSFLAFDFPTLEELFAPSHLYLNYDNKSFCGREASLTALREEENSIAILQFDDIIIFLFEDESTLTVEATFQLRYKASEETKNAKGSFLFKKQEDLPALQSLKAGWKLVLTNLFGHKERQNPPADVNCDGIVDISDLVLVGQHLGEENPSQRRVDLNGDGVVDIFDLVLIVRHFGENY